MLTDEQLVDQLRLGLSSLRPRADLAERVRQQARTSSRPLGRDRSGPADRRFGPWIVEALALVGSVVVVAAVAVAILRVGHKAQPSSATHPAVNRATRRQPAPSASTPIHRFRTPVNSASSR